MIFTVDPGKNALAIAWGSEHRVLGCYKKSIRASTIAARCAAASEAMDNLARDYEHLIRNHPKNKKGYFRLYVEQPVIRPGANVNQQDVLELGFVAAACLCVKQVVVPVFRHFPTPQQWKGTVPKDVHNQRVLDRLDVAEYKIVDAAAGVVRKKTPDHNIIDAVGLLLFAQGRLVPRRTK